MEWNVYIYLEITYRNAIKKIDSNEFFGIELKNSSVSFCNVVDVGQFECIKRTIRLLYKSDEWPDHTKSNCQNV